MKRQIRKLKGYLRQRQMGQYGVGFLADTEQGLFAVDPADLSITRELLNPGHYGPHFVRFLTNFVDRNSTAIFAGAHIGTFLVPLAKIVRRAFGYESDPKNFRFLRYNVNLNGLLNTEVFNLAVGDSNRWVSFSHNSANTGNSTIELAEGEGRNRVQMIRLDSHAEKFGEQIDLVVMDIEGAECLAIKGMEGLFGKIRAFYVEYCPEYLKRMGCSKEEFVALLRGRFRNMYLFEFGLFLYADNSWEKFILEDPKDSSYIYNFLFTNETYDIEV